MKKQFLMDAEIVKKVLLLEDLLAKASDNRTISSQLISMYAEMVEYYDHKKDPIKIYFLDKMQNTISNLTKSPKKREAEQYLGKKNVQLNASSVQLALKNLQFDSQKFFEKRNVQRTLDYKLNAALEENKKNFEYDIPQTVKTHEEKTEKMDEVVRTQLRSQEKSISAKLQERRKHSMSRSKAKENASFTEYFDKSSSGYSGLGFTNFKISHLQESFLKNQTEV